MKTSIQYLNFIFGYSCLWLLKKRRRKFAIVDFFVYVTTRSMSSLIFETLNLWNKTNHLICFISNHCWYKHTYGITTSCSDFTSSGNPIYFKIMLINFTSNVYVHFVFVNIQKVWLLWHIVTAAQVCVKYMCMLTVQT